MTWAQALFPDASLYLRVFTRPPIAGVAPIALCRSISTSSRGGGGFPYGPYLEIGTMVASPCLVFLLALLLSLGVRSNILIHTYLESDNISLLFLKSWTGFIGSCIYSKVGKGRSSGTATQMSERLD